MPMRFLRFPLSENPTTICKFRVERRGQCKWQLICKKVFGFLIKIRQNGITIIIIIANFVKLIHCPKSTLLILLGLERETSTFLESKLSKDRKSTRLNSSHVRISYAVFCLKKKKKK